MAILSSRSGILLAGRSFSAIKSSRGLVTPPYLQQPLIRNFRVFSSVSPAQSFPSPPLPFPRGSQEENNNSLKSRVAIMSTTNNNTSSSSSSSSSSTTHTLDIEELHRTALREGQSTYDDPATGFRVFTELTHLKRGFCCGNQCRHCPYGFQNVRNKAMRRPAKLQSGDKKTAKAMVAAILKHGTTEGVSISSTTMDDSNHSTSSSDSSDSNTSSDNGDRLVATQAKKGPTKTTKNVPYTRKGDGGTSQLGTGERRSKDDCNFESIGTVDELCSIVGVVHSLLVIDNDAEQYGELPTWLLDIMSRLFDIGSHLARPRPPGTVEYDANGIGGGFDSQHIDDLEEWINQLTELLPELTSFILPTGAKAASQLHVARTVCRRSERRLVPLVIDEQTCDPNALKYLNRLSDFFFVAARFVNFCEGRPEIQYQRESPQTKQRQRVPRSLK